VPWPASRPRSAYRDPSKTSRCTTVCLFRPDEAGLSLLMSDATSAEGCPVQAGAGRA
jgi:hypothetical protein